MKNRKPVQIITVVFALTMLTAYVVRSQLQQARSVAPGSKSMALAPSSPLVSGNTNAAQSQRPIAIAPGSKSPAPLLKLDTLLPSVEPNPVESKTTSDVIAWSSKSARIFDARQVQELALPKAAPVTPTALLLTNTSSNARP
jgi:hypothetical protein